MSRWLSLSALAIGCFSFALNGTAQDEMAEIYGQGLHRYFSGNYQEAERLLSLVVDSGSQDPRVHYFRGLSQYMQGRSHEAKYDFEAGAMAEARGKRVVPVGMSLQRVQGAVRLEIEKARQAARVAVLVEQAQLRRMRAEAAQAQGAVMPSPMPATPTMPAPLPSATSTSDATDPFAGAGGLQAGKPSADAAKPSANGAPSTAPTDDKTVNPFMDDPGQGAAPGATTTPAADPFTTPEAPSAPAADPFSTPTTPAPSEGAAPPAADADPFATPAAPPA